MSTASLYIGLMSGTSLDGIDCVLVDFASKRPTLLASHLLPFSPDLRAELLSLQIPGDNELHRVMLAANALADAYAKSIDLTLHKANLTSNAVCAIGMHGQTLRHRPELGFTVQIGNAARLAERTGITVVSDFRSRDVAAGGQGAPLVPAFHHSMFGDTRHRVIMNIGGIANVTDLPANGMVRGWDTGPGNVLMDGWISRHQGVAYDADGAWARAGQVQPDLLAQLLATPYCQQPPPKSTGRDLFQLAWLDQQLASHPSFATEDVQATLLAFTAESIAYQVKREAPEVCEVYVCGGGARNSALMDSLATKLDPIPVTSTQAIGLHPDWVEAVAFAWLAKQCLNQQPGNLPTVTGARGPRILGAIYPA
ncbi:anhydro-N-acetylmuramic acid kinase [Chitinimonas sp. BJB300]|nr:anhydro-N-acetylmuramic acid kinase [Chitinimonas sp. BJB300]TSJ88657.1 anhydro-N-acetylmuramic acid kinase [Chitinimonas sp. BJB300]